MAEIKQQAANIVPADSIVCVDGEWYYCPGEYPQPCVGPFDTEKALAAFLMATGVEGTLGRSQSAVEGVVGTPAGGAVGVAT